MMDELSLLPIRKGGQLVSKDVRLELPLTEEQVRDLNVGDNVYLSGYIFTMRDMGHRRAVEMLERGEELPFDLTKGAIWHCGPIVRKQSDGKWEIVAAGSTTSSRFTYLGSDLIKQLKVRSIIGKGTMGQPTVRAMNEVGACFLNTTGGCAALYAEQIEEVVDVFWTDLGLPEAIWWMKVKDMGPLVVGIDSHDKSLFDSIGETMRTNLKKTYQQSNIRLDYNLSYLPKRVAGKASYECY